MDIYSFQKPVTLLQYPLRKKQYIYSNYIIPVCFSCFIYVLHFASDTVLAYQHYRQGDPFHGALTLFWIFVPAVGSFFLAVINLELWPEEKHCGLKSVKWFFIRFFQHLLFPAWAMLRFAELLFWRIEALRSDDEAEQKELLTKSRRRSVFSLYQFLQAYFQAIPQILLQLRIILQHPSDFNKQTVDMQVMSIVMSLIKVSMTTTAYQRFTSQKLAGREYSWDKIKEKRRSTTLNIRKSIIENENQESVAQDQSRRNSGLSTTSSQFEANKEANKNKMVIPMRVDSVHGMTEDDSAGKFVAILWWFCFILPRVIIISAFVHYFPLEGFLLCFFHYIIVLIILVKFTTIERVSELEITQFDGRKRYQLRCNITNDMVLKTAFYLIISFIYLFCLIEFKIKFTKVKRVYYCYFVILYLQNFIMMYMWYFYLEKASLWWFDYLFYLTIVSSLLSLLSMAMYLKVLKPKKIIVNQVYRNSRL